MTPSAPTILILADPADEHAQHVLATLIADDRATDCRAHLVDTSDFPARLQLSADERGNGRIVTIDGTQLAWSDITSICWRQYNGIGTNELPNAEQAYIAANDARSLIESMFLRLPCRWVNGFDGFRLHQTKPAALQHVAALDLPDSLAVPHTLWSNEPDAIHEFVATHGQCIFKPVQGGAHTQPFLAEHLTDEHMSNLRFAPVTVQQRITGTDIRVFVAGEKVEACEITTDHLDFRDDADPTITPIQLPAEITQACVRIARSLHLQWTGIDLRRTNTGQYFYFEANPSPMFMGFEAHTALPLTAMLCDLLTN